VQNCRILSHVFLGNSPPKNIFPQFSIFLLPQLFPRGICLHLPLSPPDSTRWQPSQLHICVRMLHRALAVFPLGMSKYHGTYSLLWMVCYQVLPRLRYNITDIIWHCDKQTCKKHTPLVFNRISNKKTEILDRKLLKSAVIHCSEAQWYLVCTKVVCRIRAVQFWIIYYCRALSEPSYYVPVKQFITFLFSWGESAAPSPDPTSFLWWR